MAQMLSKNIPSPFRLPFLFRDISQSHSFLAFFHIKEYNCLYHVDIPENEDDEVTDIVIINPGDKTVKFGSGNFATISITEVSD